MAGRDSRTPSPYSGSSGDELAGIFGGMQIGASPRASPRPSVVPMMRTPSPPMRRPSATTFTSRRYAAPKTKAPKKPQALKGGKAKAKAKPIKRTGGKRSPPQKRKK